MLTNINLIFVWYRKFVLVAWIKKQHAMDVKKESKFFSGDNTLNAFCEWLFSEKNYQATVLCHNFQGYDSYPILQYLYKNSVLPNVVANGAKIMSLTVPHCKIKMIDSINFLPMALAKLPRCLASTSSKRDIFLIYLIQRKIRA